MVDNVLINKAASIEKSIARVREEYQADISSFATNFSRQDAAMLNILRACEAAIDMAQHIVRSQHLGIAQSSRQLFDLLSEANIIDRDVSQVLQNMVGFRNIAVHEYQKIQLDIVVAIIETHLTQLEQFSQRMVRQFA